jgi:hypothetical protein
MASTITTYDFALKEWQTEQKMNELWYADNVFLGLIKKDPDMQGNGHPVPVICTAPQGVGGTSLATVQATQGNVAGFEFLLKPGDYFGVVTMGDKVIQASRSNPGAFLSNKTAEIDSLNRQMAESLEICALSNGGNSLGRVSSAWSNTSYFTLTDTSQACNFEVGMYIVSDTVDGSGGAGTVNAGSTYVTAVDRETGLITINAYSGITSFAANDYIFRRGDYTGASGNVIIEGVGSYILASGTSAPALYGMTRTSDPQRLAGCRIAATAIAGKSIEERMQLLGAYMVGRYKGPGPDNWLLHPEDWQSLAISLQSRGQRSLTDASTSFGYEYLEIVAGGKKGKVYPARHATKGTALALKLDTWTMFSMLDLIHPLNGDGLQVLRASTTNDYEYRAVSYPCLGNNAPGWNGRVALP